MPFRRFETIFEALPGPHMVLDRELRFVAVNAAYERAVGRGRAELLGQALFEMFPNTGEAGRRLRESLERVLERGESETLAFIHYEIPGPDGRMEDRYWTAVHVPLPGEDGAPAYVMQNTVDVTELQRLRTEVSLPNLGLPAAVDLLQRAQEAEEAQTVLARRSDDFQRLFAQAPGFMAVTSGPEHTFTFTNAAYEQLTGRKGLVGKTVAEALPEVVEQGFVDLLDGVYATGKPYVGEATLVRLALDEGPLEDRYLDFSYHPIFDSEGRVSGIFTQGADRTESVKAQARQQLLLDELNHRVKNSLATVQSIAAQTMRSSPEPKAFRQAFEARLMSLSQVHNLLTSTNWEGADFRAVLAGELAPHGADRVAMRGPPVRLSSQEALNLALIVHELATNAAKYGALSVPAGRVALNWSVEPGERSRRLTLRWAETGGPPVAPPTRRGFGSRLIERTAQGDLNGRAKLDYRPEGLVADIELLIG